MRLQQRAVDDIYDYVDGDGEDLPPDDARFESLSDLAIAQAQGATQPTDNVEGVSGIAGTNYSYINDVSNSYSLVADADGNFYVGNGGQGTRFAANQGNVITDESGLYFHYYPDLMQKYGVSRFRSSNQTAIPKVADIVALVPVDYSQGENPLVYVAMDTSEGVFLTITCDFEEGSSKVFLVQDASDGIGILKDPKLRYTVTGGIVTDCYYLPWVPSTT